VTFYAPSILKKSDAVKRQYFGGIWRYRALNFRSFYYGSFNLAFHIRQYGMWKQNKHIQKYKKTHAIRHTHTPTKSKY